ncbi:MAG: lysostaphin resistance A-like protein [Halocynthiibacter sp.]
MALYFGLNALGFFLTALFLGHDSTISLTQELSHARSSVSVIFLFSTFIPLLLATTIAVRIFHKRKFKTLVGPYVATLKNFGQTTAISFVFFAFVIAISSIFDRPLSNLSFGEWLTFLVPLLLLLFIQITAEEVLFRGYVLQQVAARFSAPWVYIFIPSLIFAALHWNPSAGALNWLFIGATFQFAVLATDLTIRTGNLGAAMGVHFVNNLFGVLVLSLQGTMDGAALFVTEYSIENPGPLGWSIAGNMVLMMVLWKILRIRLRC